jgi:hypothetical protein
MKSSTLVAATIVFAPSSCIPTLSFGCLHHATTYLGLPFPWLGITVTYGPLARIGGSVAHGPVAALDGLDILWVFLPLQLAAALLIVRIAKLLATSGAALKRWIGNFNSL